MIKSLKELFVKVLYIYVTFVAIFQSFQIAKWYYLLKKGSFYDFLKFMSLENSFIFAIIVFIVSFIVIAMLYGILVGIIDYILDFFVIYFWQIVGISFLGILALPFVFFYAFLVLPIKNLYIFIKYRAITLRIKFWNLYPFILLCILCVAGFLFYYFNIYDLLQNKYKEFSKFISNMKKFDYTAFFYFMIFCFIANLISFVFILFFKKMEKVLYINIYEYFTNQTNANKNKKQSYQNSMNDKTIHNKQLQLACKIFSINVNKIDEITLDELKNRYHKLARMFHPDLHKNNQEQMNEKMKEINAAYEFLGQYLNNLV